MPARFFRVWAALALIVLVASFFFSLMNAMTPVGDVVGFGKNLDEQLLTMWANNATTSSTGRAFGFDIDHLFSSASAASSEDDSDSDDKDVEHARANNKVEDEASEDEEVLLQEFPPPIQYGMDKLTAGAIGCCGDAKHRGKKTDLCKLTCFTKHACNDSKDFSDMLPFSSVEEQKWFTQPAPGEPDPTTDVFSSMCRTRYRNHPTLPDQPTWCGLDDGGRHLGRGHGGDVNWTGSLWQGCIVSPFDRMMVFPQGKLALCGIPKVGVTQWQKFLRYTIGAQDFESLPYYKQDVWPLFFHRLPWHRQVEIMRDPSWTKALFLRHPGERILSAFLDKIKGKAPDKNPHHNKTFPEWLKTIQSEPENKRWCTHPTPSWCTDPHWRPQFYSCGMHELLPYFDFVGSMDHAANHTKALLEKVGMWDRYGRTYVTSVNPFGSMCAKLPPDPDTRPSYTQGFQQNLAARTDRHTHNAKSKLQKHLTNSTSARLRQMYAQDYQLWEALEEELQNNHNQATHGAALAHRLNPRCSSRSHSQQLGEKS